MKTALQQDHETILNLRKACEKAERTVGGRSAGIHGTQLYTAIRHITEAVVVAEYRCAEAVADEEQIRVSRQSALDAVRKASPRRQRRAR